MDYEALVREIWSEELGEPDIIPSDDFFEIGGDSFQATQTLARLRAALGAQVPMSLLFENSVLKDYAALLADWHAAQAGLTT